MIRVLLSGVGSNPRRVGVEPDAGLGLTAIVEGPEGMEICQRQGIPAVQYAFKHRFDLRGVALYRDLLRQHRFDILHCLTSRALSTALLATRGMERPPRIVAYRGTLGHLRLWNPAARLAHLNPRIAAIVCVSDAVRRYLLGLGIPDSRLAVIWKGHDPAWYAAAPRETLAGFGVPPGAVVAGFVGNMRPVKGADVLLAAFGPIVPADNLHLLMIGEVRERRIARQAGRHPCIHFTGFRPDAAALAGACDIAVMPSVAREGLPRAILEVMAQGVPPVVTDVGGLPELVVDGDCGLVVPPRDPAALRAAILRLARDAELRRRFGAAARARIEGPFHYRHTVDKTLALYRKLLGQA